MKEKINVTLDPEVLKVIDQFANELHISRSAALNHILYEYKLNYKDKVENGYIMYKVN